MTIRFHHTPRCTGLLLRTEPRRRLAIPSAMDRRFLADVGLSQTDIITLRTR